MVVFFKKIFKIIYTNGDYSCICKQIKAVFVHGTGRLMQVVIEVT